MDEISKVCVIEEFKGARWLAVEVHGEIREGGSNAHNSDEPSWREVTITDIWNTRRCVPVSDRLKNAIITDYGDYLREELSDEYNSW